MRIRDAVAPLALLAPAAYAIAAIIGQSTPARPITADRLAVLPAAQQAAWKDYLARSARQMQADRAFLQAEMKRAGVVSASVPPSGSAARSLPLDRPAEWYGGAEAGRIAEIVVSFQTPAGGWSKNLNLADHHRKPGESFAPGNASAFPGRGDFDTPHELTWSYVGTLDNDATTAELQYLAKAAEAGKGGDVYRRSIVHGIEYLLAAQFPNGGWPQVWPLEGGYHDAITFNDGAVARAVTLLQEVADGHAGFAFVPGNLRAKARASAAKGIECILATQIVHDGRRTVWAQQHDALDLQPVAARNYEPAAQSASESAALALLLMRLPRPDPAVVAAVHAAAEWFRKTAIHGKVYQDGPGGRLLSSEPGAGPLWSRFYEIGSDRPVFGDRDKSIHDDVNEISAERRNGYSWYNAGPQAALDRYAEWILLHPAVK